MQQLIVKSLTGKHYTAQALIDRNRRINGERDITLSFLFNESIVSSLNILKKDVI
ncbi:hypothetical protein [Macrococcoides caseolyticum]|uniref:hypothetical protein n=1 Tax=Macrococcoides caseolyticum TaxID=69966 RepID=UPI0012FEB31A|nr:hypothetical protein [Macrococcus caseolyticus]